MARVNFMKSFLTITTFFDNKYDHDFSNILKKDISKYSYPVISIHRDKGISNFIHYNKILRKEIGIHNSIYYYVYYYALLIIGKKYCDKIILFVKKIINGTPRL